eukprot:TRINITY_DN2283_c0_g1_i15.p1 TRINITY_DN2283_c0_g1~~TRINITY_DN2283_c0_g1_i15.p1  ORF type:complete len:827 (+),score=196.14 TRINITY_DN2283_c0_g1_i15:61-2541(+)
MSVLMPALVMALATNQPDPPIPPNMKEMECAIHKLAIQYGSRYPDKIPVMNPNSLSDALNLWNCSGTVPQKNAKPAKDLISPPSDARNSWFVDTKRGSDAIGKGSIDSPWRSVTHALAHLPTMSDRRTLFLREGTYYLNETISLTAAHSKLTISAYISDKGTEKVTLSGAGGVVTGWNCSNLLPDCKVYEAKVDLPKRGENLAPEVVNQLFANGKRMIRAKYPNADPAVTEGHCFSKPQFANEKCNWLTSTGGNTAQDPGRLVGSVALGPNRGNSPTVGCGKECNSTCATFSFNIYDPPAGHPVYNKPLPGMGWNNNSLFSRFPSPFGRPADMGVAKGDLPRQWKKPSTGIVHTFHSLLWGGWMYRIKDRQDLNITLAYGGYQEARGAQMKTNHYYVENLIEELDVPSEWFFDEDTDTVYLYPNSTEGGFPEVTIPTLDTLISVKDAHDVVIQGLTITQTRATFMEQYEVPSGGDWSIHRGAAVYIEDSHRINVTGCEFIETGGNAVILSNNVTFSHIESNEFYRTGDSGIVSLGMTNGINGMAATYPMNNTIAFNHMHEYGVYGKQTSCYFQSLTANSTVFGNICYNGPRAGFNYNDGFGGAYQMSQNLLFNHVRETADHGAFNSWDRQPYLTRSGVDDGFPDSVKLGLKGSSIVKAQSHITQNFIINGYSGVWAVDHDDGSQFYNDSSNFMVWGGCKNFLGHSKSCDHNLIVYPGIPNRANGARRCQTDDNGVFANQYFYDNQCITGDGIFYTFAKCTTTNLPETVYQTFNNQFYSPKTTFVENCGQNLSFSEWQKLGQDRGSNVTETMSLQEILSTAREKLNF